MGAQQNVPSWSTTDAAVNAAATATRVAPSTGLHHHITSISGSFDAATAGKRLILKQGSTEIARWYVHNSLVLNLTSPIRLKAGEVANLELEAGGSSVTGAATMTGYTL